MGLSGRCVSQPQLPQVNLQLEKASKIMRAASGHVNLAGVLGVDEAGAEAEAQADDPARETGIRALAETAIAIESETLEIGIETVIETAEKGTETGAEGAAAHETARGDTSNS